jgi:thioredoxin 1
MENVTPEEIKELQTNGKKILVDFWATWCGPCKQLIPRLEKIEHDYTDVVFVKVDVDENQDYALELGIRSVPTVIIYSGEELLHRSSGLQPDSVYKEVLDTL